MATADQRSYAKSFLKKAEEYAASAEDNLAAERHTPAAGDAIHAGISSKNAIVTALTGSTSKRKTTRRLPRNSGRLWGTTRIRRGRESAAGAALRERRCGVGVALVSAAKAESLVRRARTLVELAVQIVRLGR